MSVVATYHACVHCGREYLVSDPVSELVEGMKCPYCGRSQFRLPSLPHKRRFPWVRE